MFRYFTAAQANGNFPLELACGTFPRGGKRIPSMTALAVPAKIGRWLEEALRTTNEAAVGTSHCWAVCFFATHSL